MCILPRLPSRPRKLSDIAEQMPDGQVKMKLIKAGWVTVSSGRVRFRIVAWPGEQFPEIPSGEKDHEHHHILHTEDIRDLICKSAYAMATDTSRITLMGMMLEFVPAGIVPQGHS